MKAVVVIGLASMCGCTFQGSSGGGRADSGSGPDAGAETDAPTASDDAIGAATMVTLIDGVDGYAGTLDTYIHEGEANVPHGAELIIEADGSDASSEVWGLLRFELGGAGNPVPTAASVLEATLTITVIDVGQDLELHNALVDWDELSTWDGLGQPSSGRSFDRGTVATVPQGMLGEIDLDVTSSVARWLADPSSNRGWFFEPTGGNGVELGSRESPTKPRLVITFAAN